ncbi:hypothetical protein PoB_001354400 [Plakobranchus ocellatus]|uniref:Uncharacterized protein n=1 Tax=Plakobranchus ocellatus TaxID=259542 RepID=A0AAV3YZ63_9GAST|nr:hypothetical protein PoB_001354400 [Plakobranchus ocellatus]
MSRFRCFIQSGSRAWWHRLNMFSFTKFEEFRTIPQQGDLRLSGPPSGQDAGGGARTRDRRVPADLRADSLATVPPTPPAHSMTQQ